LVVFGSDVGTD